MNETSKAVTRRLHSPGFVGRYLVGNGVDVGCGPDSIGAYRHLFPFMGKVDEWDLAQGDAQALAGIPDGHYDWLHSSHCLEHMIDPFKAVTRWCEVVRPGGWIIILIPDEDLYEMGVWPPRWNLDHKWSFTIHKASSWCPASINLTELVCQVANIAKPVKIELLCNTFDEKLIGKDQTLGPVAESAIEIILQRI